MVPFSNVRIIPKDYFERVGKDYFLAHPVGSGPWKFVEHIWDQRFKMEANTDYWGEVPAYQYVIDLHVPEELTQISMFRLGEVDYISVSDARTAELQDYGYRTVEVGLPILANISFQGTWFESAGPVQDIRVRRAMSYAINRQEICDTYYHGNAVPGGTFYMHPGCWGWTDELVADAYDPNKAKALLAEADYPGGVSGIHIYSINNYLVPLLEILQDDWKEVGIQVDLELVTGDMFWNYMIDFDGMTESDPNAGWIFPWVFDSTFNSVYYAQNLYCSWGLHNAGHDTTADALYNKACSELNPNLALEYYQDFCFTPGQCTLV